ncbi:Gfo/Idh/MocA family oxidoreductase [Loktanella sp. F6476L]|uniref:Gfo/Idh/MocA family protein n=1 Tax=Loktanella sp. F6476L TaxID=2926405 RepID=UPI001FF58431|nr:Gfo/Idh/MocA family oxidoreductase [Loktanella sp. F6476L]
MNSILIIGLGSIGRRHLRNAATRFPNAKLTVLRHRQEPDLEAENLGATIISDPDEAFGQEFDIVVLATPSANHIDILPDLIARGYNLLVEKPVVSAVADCDTIIQSLKTAPAATRTAGFNFRYLPSLQKAKDAIDAGTLGRPARANFTAGLWLPDWRPTQDYRTCYSADAARGGGVELDLVHEIDVARWFFGELKLEHAHCARLSNLEINANDTALMTLSGQGGAPLIHVALDYVSRQRVRHYEIIGDETGLQWDLSGHLNRLTPNSIETVTVQNADFDVPQTYLSMFDRIASAIQGNTEPHLQTLEDGIASTRLALQARDQGTLI